MKKLLALLLLASAANAATYYEKTTIPPTIAAHTILGNSTGATAAPGQLTTIPAAAVPVFSGDCANSVASSVLVCTQAAANFNVIGTLSMATLNPPTNTFAPAETDFTNVGTSGVALVNGVAGSVTAGTYPAVSCTGGTGTGLVVTVVSTAGTATSITATTAGTGFSQSDSISCNTGSGTATGAVRTLNNPTVRWLDSSATANYGNWLCAAFSASTPSRNFRCGTTSDSFATARYWLTVTGTGAFGSSTVYTALTFGNSSDNATYTFAGTGLTTLGGGLTVTGTTTLTTGLALSNLATQATNTVLANVTSGTAVPTATAVATCSTAGSALKWTTNTGFGCNTAIDAATSTGVTDASAATAGKVGEVYSVNCPAPSTATITISVVGSPGTVSWPSHPFSTVGSPANWTCAINFVTGTTLPTGLVAGTTYYIVGAGAAADTFQLADTAAHAIAGTNKINITDAGTGTQTGHMGGTLGTGAGQMMVAVALVAGDWDCSGTGEYGNLTSLTATNFQTGINQSTASFPSLPDYARHRSASSSYGTADLDQVTPVVRELISSTTNTYLWDLSTFSGGTQEAAGFLRCRRMR